MHGFWAILILFLAFHYIRWPFKLPFLKGLKVAEDALNTFSGFKPYSDRTSDYAGAPDIVWTEGTLGYVCLALILGEEQDAKKYVDECIAIQNCDGCTGGILYVTATYGMLPWEFHVWESVVSSSWLYLIIHNPDVLFPRTLRQVYYMAKINNIHDERP